jgi:hypothetical protein
MVFVYTGGIESFEENHSSHSTTTTTKYIVPLYHIIIMFVPNLQDVDARILSFCGACTLGVVSLVSRQAFYTIMSPDLDELLWAPAVTQFIEGFSLPIADVLSGTVLISRVYGGYRELLRYRKASGYKPGAGHINSQNRQETADCFRPFLADISSTVFFTDYYLRDTSQTEPEYKYLMTQAQDGLEIANYRGEYREFEYVTGYSCDFAVAIPGGPYEQRCRPTLQTTSDTITVQLSAIDFSKRNQFCREVLLDEYNFDPRHVLSPPSEEEEFFSLRNDQVTNILTFFTWNDAMTGLLNCLASWNIDARAFPCFFTGGEEFMRDDENNILEESPLSAVAHAIVTGRHAMGEPDPLNPVLLSHLEGPYDLNRARLAAGLPSIVGYG